MLPCWGQHTLFLAVRQVKFVYGAYIYLLLRPRMTVCYEIIAGEMP